MWVGYGLGWTDGPGEVRWEAPLAMHQRKFFHEGSCAHRRCEVLQAVLCPARMRVPEARMRAEMVRIPTSDKVLPSNPSSRRLSKTLPTNQRPSALTGV